MSSEVDLGTDAVPRKSRPIVLDPDMNPTRAFFVVATECTEHWRTNEALLVHSRAMPHLHQTRVGIRRLRSAVSLLRPVLGRSSPVVDAAHRLRELALPLGLARDLDVILAGDVLQGSHKRQVARLWAAREAAYDEVLHVLGTKKWAKTRRAMDRALAELDARTSTDTSVTEVAGRALDKRWHRVAGVHDHVAAMTPAERHRVRIEAKKFRYGCEFFASLYAGDEPQVVTNGGEELTGPLAYAWHVENVQTALGAVNDHHTAEELLSSVGATSPAVDEEALVAEGVAACHRLAAVEPFWR